jgi:predicted negative regulator of RcsB-dependent stress response
MLHGLRSLNLHSFMDAHTLTTPGLTWLFLGVVVGLGTAFVWMLWEFEQRSKPRRNIDRFG